MDFRMIVPSFLVLGVVTYLITYFGKKKVIPLTLSALAAGILFNVGSQSLPMLILPTDFFATLVLLAVIIMVFDSTARLKLNAADSTALHALAFVTLFASLSFVCFVLIAAYMLNLSTIASVVLAAALLGVSAEFISRATTSAHMNALIQLEAYWTAPVALLLPLLVSVVAPPMQMIFVSEVINFFLSTIMMVGLSVGVGIFMGVLLMKIVKHVHGPTGPGIILAAACMTFGLTHYFSGYGLFAVGSLGFFFANALRTIGKHFAHLEEMVTQYAETLMIILFSSAITIPSTIGFFGRSIGVFLLYLVVRFIAVRVSHRKQHVSRKEETVLTLYAPNSAAACTVLLYLNTFPPTSIPLKEIAVMMYFGLMMIIYSNSVSYVLAKFSWLKVR